MRSLSSPKQGCAKPGQQADARRNGRKARRAHHTHARQAAGQENHRIEIRGKGFRLGRNPLEKESHPGAGGRGRTLRTPRGSNPRALRRSFIPDCSGCFPAKKAGPVFAQPCFGDDNERIQRKSQHGRRSRQRIDSRFPERRKRLLGKEEERNGADCEKREVIFPWKTLNGLDYSWQERKLLWRKSCG